MLTTWRILLPSFPATPNPSSWIIHESVLIPAKELGSWLVQNGFSARGAQPRPVHLSDTQTQKQPPGSRWPARTVPVVHGTLPSRVTTRGQSHRRSTRGTPAEGHLQILGWERMWFGYTMCMQLASGERESLSTAIIILVACTVNAPCTCNNTVVTFHQCELLVENRSSSLRLQDQVICLLAALCGVWVNDAAMGRLTGSGGSQDEALSH